MSFDFDGKQLVEVLLPEGENDERLFLEQGSLHHYDTWYMYTSLSVGMLVICIW